MSTVEAMNIDANNLSLFENEQLLPINHMIHFDIEQYRERLLHIKKNLETLFEREEGVKTEYSLVLEPGYPPISFFKKRLWELTEPDRKHEYSRKIFAEIYYEPAHREGSFKLVGIANHVWMDRRIMEALNNLDIPIQNLQIPSPNLISQLKSKYGSLFFKKIIWDLKEFLNANVKLRIDRAFPLGLSQIDIEKDELLGENVYGIFYELMGNNIEGDHLLLVVKDLYNSEFKKTGIFHCHSWYGFIVRHVSFPCTREEFTKQIYDTSRSSKELFEGAYDDIWVLNDHSAFNAWGKSFAFQDDELYITKNISLSIMKWCTLYELRGPMSAGSLFLLQKMDEEGRRRVIHQKRYDRRKAWLTYITWIVAASSCAFMIHSR